LNFTVVNESSEASPFTGVVLAGGRSSRMSRDKAMIPLPNGRSLLDQAFHVDVGD
jgi:molybdopterin-guanine dinucleotide biosynthesis protein A